MAINRTKSGGHFYTLIMRYRYL